MPERQQQESGCCLCGAVSWYRVEGSPIDSGYCHCRMCQRPACNYPHL
jgi:hypothetical protein